MSCEIIQISAAIAARRFQKEKQAERQVHALMAEGIDPRRQEGLWEDYSAARTAKRKARLLEATTAPETLTETCRNSRLREARREAWRTAEHLTRFARARMDWHAALSCAQSWRVPGADHYPTADEGDGRFDLVTIWRGDLVQQMLTPAPDLGAIAWKRTQLKGGQHEHIGVKAETIERAIAADEKWLTAHPSIRSKPMSTEAKEHRRNFKEAMRQRIREVAASRDLSDEEIKPALSLKHFKLVKFVEKHGINWQWLLEGAGRMFRKDPIRLSPNSTGEEFAAVVTTLPMADQQAISTMVREILQERDQ
jgi:hypothetical protein